MIGGSSEIDGVCSWTAVSFRANDCLVNRFWALNLGQQISNRRDEFGRQLTPDKIGAVFQSQKSCGQFSRSHHGRENDFAAIIDAVSRDRNHLRRESHGEIWFYEGCKCSKHPSTILPRSTAVLLSAVGVIVQVEG